MTSPADLAARLRTGDRRALSEALNLLEDRRAAKQPDIVALLDLLLPLAADQAKLSIGITGPPGAGKSTLTGALIDRYRAQGKTVGVLAVDPSSPISGGALLGDRIRMIRSTPDAGLFIRSLAGRGELGGLSAAAFPLQLALLAVHDVAIVETIGVGQTEVDVMHQVDISCLVAQPASGDTIQFLKAGILELPALIAVNKADGNLREAAERAAAELRRALQPQGGRQVPVVLVSALTQDGVETLCEQIAAHHEQLNQRSTANERRRLQAAAWIVKRLSAEFGSHGLNKLGGSAAITQRLALAPSCFAEWQVLGTLIN